ncbi:MAG: hypothetical protein PSY14_02430 [bacterium]|nr:hypothetical protein [bacterium]
MFSNAIIPAIRTRSLAAAIAVMCLISVAAVSYAQDLIIPPPEGAAPPPTAGGAAAPPPTVGNIGDGSAAMPTVPPPKVAKRDEPRTDEPMDEMTEFFQRKVFAVPESRPGKTLTYFFKPPAPYQPKDKQYPLVIILHDEDGMAPAAQFLAQKAARKNFPAFIAVPVLPDGPIWAFPAKMDDKKLVANLKKEQALPDIVKLIPHLVQDNPLIDLNRVYVVGCGDGGFGVFGAAAKFPHIFAGGVPISGGWALREAPKLKNMPMFVMAGDSDKEVDPGLSQNLAFYIQQNGGRKIAFLSIPGMGHDCTNPYLYNNAVWSWLFKQHK